MIRSFILFNLLLGINIMCFAQDSSIKKGNTVYIKQNSTNQQAKESKDYKEYLAELLDDWGYWKVTDTEQEADFIFELNILSFKDSFASSLSLINNKAVIADATLRTKDGIELWQSEKYKAGQQGMLGYNAGKAAVKKLVKVMKKKFSK